jgi:translation initiation factor IF-3
VNRHKDAGVLSNETIPRLFGPTPVRLIDEHGKNMGVMDATSALAAAVQAGMDLLVLSEHANPPVVKIGSKAVAVAEAEREQAEQRKKAKKREPKEIRLTARTGDHDIGIKAGRVVEFLREGRPVKVVVSFSSPNAGLKEEPARRDVMARVVRIVMAEAGAGLADGNSIRAEGTHMHAMFNPVSASPSPAQLAKLQAEANKVLGKLAMPLRAGAAADAEAEPAAAAAAAATTAARAAASVAAEAAKPGPAAAGAAGPSVSLQEVMARLASAAGKKGGKGKKKVGVDEDEEEDEEMAAPAAGGPDEDVLAGPAGRIGGRGRRRRGGPGEL